jgi:hypothetical protein
MRTTHRPGIVTMAGTVIIAVAVMQGAGLARAGSAAASVTPTVRDASVASADPNAHLDYTPGQAPKYWSAATTIRRAFDDYSRNNNGGTSPEVWSEGLGWYALVLVETLADLPKNHAKEAVAGFLWATAIVEKPGRTSAASTGR